MSWKYQIYNEFIKKVKEDILKLCVDKYCEIMIVNNNNGYNMSENETTMKNALKL